MSFGVVILCFDQNGYLGFKQTSYVTLNLVEMGIDHGDNRDPRVDNHVSNEDTNPSDDDSGGNDGADNGSKPNERVCAFLGATLGFFEVHWRRRCKENIGGERMFEGFENFMRERK